MGFWRRHDVIRLCSEDAFDDIAVCAVMGDDGRGVVVLCFRVLLLVEAQVALAVAFVRSVALVAVLREDGLDVPIEIDRRGRGQGHGGEGRDAGYKEK